MFIDIYPHCMYAISFYDFKCKSKTTSEVFIDTSTVIMYVCIVGIYCWYNNSPKIPNRIIT